MNVLQRPEASSLDSIEFGGQWAERMECSRFLVVGGNES